MRRRSLRGFIYADIELVAGWSLLKANLSLSFHRHSGTTVIKKNYFMAEVIIPDIIQALKAIKHSKASNVNIKHDDLADVM